MYVVIEKRDNQVIKVMPCNSLQTAIDLTNYCDRVLNGSRNSNHSFTYYKCERWAGYIRGHMELLG